MERYGFSSTKGKRIAHINGKHHVYLDEDDSNKLDKAIHLDDDVFQLTVDPKDERQVLYVNGPSGSGKSYFTSKYAAEYKKVHPKNEIILFSPKPQDDCLDKIGLHRFNFNHPDWLDETIDIDEFKDSLIIYDDMEAVSDKKLRKKIADLLNALLVQGRSNRISVVVINHNACSGHYTKLILNECTSCTFFPSASTGKDLKYLLEAYFGLNKRQIDKVKNVDSRHVTILKTYPQIILTECDIGFVKKI